MQKPAVIISLELEIFGVGRTENISKQQKWLLCSDDFLCGDDSHTVSVLMTMVQTLLKQLKKSLQMEAIITSAPSAL